MTLNAKERFNETLLQWNTLYMFTKITENFIFEDEK